MAYNVKYRTEFTDILGVDWRVDIEEDGWYDDSNLLTNPGFEGGFTNWNTLNGPNISTVTDEKYDGNMCVRCDGAYNTINIISQDYQGVKKGQQYTASWWQKNLNITAGTTNPYMRFNIAYFNGLTYVGEAADSVNPPSNSDWQFNSFTFTTRTDLDYDRLRIHSIYMRDATGVIWVDNVKLEEGPVATPGYTELIPTDDPLKIEYLTPSDELFYDPIKGSTVRLNIECSTNFQYIDLYSEADMTYKLKVYYGDTPTLYWQGWVSNDYTEPYDAVPYTVSITALDGLGLLKYIDFKNGSSYYSGREKERTVILNILSKIGYTTFNEFVNLYDKVTLSDIDDCIFDQIYIEQDLFQGKDCYTVLVEILKHYNSIIRQYCGVFYIYRPTELVADLVYGRNVTSSTITGISITPDQYLYRAGENTSDLRDVNGGMLMFKAPAATVRGLQNYNQAPSWIKNSSFDIDTYDEGTGQFANWDYSLSDGFFTKMSDVEGWEKETNGVATSYSGTAKYLFQEFGTYIIPTSNIMEFSFDYMFKNATSSNINMRIYIRIKDTANNVWLTNKASSNTELEESTSAEYIMTEEFVIEPGLGNWNTWKRYIIGLTEGGTYQVYLQTAVKNVTTGFKNIVFRATSDKIVKRSLPKLPKWYNWVMPSNASLYRYFEKNAKFYSLEDQEEIVEREYIKTNSINGEKPDVTYDLGDVSDTDINNVATQFNGSLFVPRVATLSEVAESFVLDNSSYYFAGGVNVTSIDNKIRFTSTTAGTNFTGSTSISNFDGDLSGSVANIQPNLTAIARVDEVYLEGSNGTVLITCNSVTRLGSWAGTIDDTGAAFVSSHADAYAAGGVTVTYNSFQNKLIFTAATAGQNFTGDTTAVTLDGTLTGTVIHVTPNGVAQARIDEITLTGTTGGASVTCDGVTKDAFVWLMFSPTTSWSTRGGSEKANLLEFLIDEIAATKSKGRMFLQLNLMETDADSFFKIVSNLQDPINLSGVNYRLFIPTRGEYNVRDREWTVDLLEIDEKAAPL